MLVLTVFLYHMYISSFRLVFVASRHAYRHIWNAMGRVSGVQLAICSVILRYKASWLSGGCWRLGLVVGVSVGVSRRMTHSVRR